MSTRPLRVAIVGAGPAGIYAADSLMKSETAQDPGVSIDLFERMPAPFGLIRYGVAPDHPRIKGIVTALHKVLDKPQVRLFGHVDFGTDITMDDMRRMYDAVIFSTGAVADRAMRIPGIDLDGSFGAAEFVGWYDGHPDFPRTWPLDAEKVAVLGLGNVSLDVARVLAKTADELLVTEIPDNVYEGLKSNKAKEIHVFGRRGPAQAKFSPLELKELDHSKSIEVVVDEADLQYDEASITERASSKILDTVVKIIEGYAVREDTGRPHKLFIHFFENPVEILGEDGKVIGLRTERTELDGKGGVRGTGKFTEWPIGAVYRAVGYRSDELSGVPFDPRTAVVPNELGRVLADGAPVPGVYATGWIKRGPVGLIGHTKRDSAETVSCVLEDHAAGALPPTIDPRDEAIVEFLEAKNHPYTTWEGWYRLDSHERKLGEPHGRERVKLVEREDMIAASRDD
ncbi:FAD-dependent oxidoreductase [Hoyosella rhizosphaerae]|uniref:ferredoxin--NADP(+) reductase n=1 Tax=Hoyosella rhizosphaerae TaxID=1755582 RepID=A0A916XBT5_9ACTN|nr:FAD-dependent oxidoreductase [Hoyosella rhizosphaerae]MBN4927738.1 FAD-dependent oxidoreductase [Hoyosella rhizosphaerae]GGC61956.1 pyridine nucleotide-disulfide oxidoreductase [Hoyosella rhizosphaerae]